MPSVIRSVSVGASFATAQPLQDVGADPIQDGDFVIGMGFRPANANPSPFGFDNNTALVTFGDGIGVRVATMVWNTGEATSYTSSNSTLGYVFIVVKGDAAAGAGAIQSVSGTTGNPSVPALTLNDSDGSSRVITVILHRDATALEAVDGTTKLLTDFSPAANALISVGATGGVTSWTGDATVVATDSPGSQTGWRSVAIELLGPNAVAPPTTDTGRFFAIL